MNSVLLTPNPKSRSTGESDSGKVCIIHKHGRANYGTIQTLTIKRWEKIQEIKDIRSNAENEREQQTLICERIPPVVDFAQHGYHQAKRKQTHLSFFMVFMQAKKQKMKIWI